MLVRTLKWKSHFAANKLESSALEVFDTVLYTRVHASFILAAGNLLVAEKNI